MLARKGYRRAGVSDFIARAGVARGTFYLYFDSKERVLLAILDRFHQEIKLAFEAMDTAANAARSLGPRAVLEGSFRAWLEFFEARRDAARIVLREAPAIDARFETALAELRRAALTRFATRFRRLQDEGVASSHIEPSLAAHIHLGVLDELLTSQVIADGDADIPTLARQLAHFVWNGIRADREP